MDTIATSRSVSGDHSPDHAKTCLDDEEFAYPVHASYQPHQHLHQLPAQPCHHQHTLSAPHQEQEHLHPSSLVGNGHDRRQANMSTGSDLVQVTVEDLLISDQQDLHARNSFRKQQASTHAANPFPPTIVSQSLGNPPSSSSSSSSSSDLQKTSGPATASGVSSQGPLPTSSQQHSQPVPLQAPPLHSMTPPQTYHAPPTQEHAFQSSQGTQPYQQHHQSHQSHQHHQQQPSSPGKPESASSKPPLTPAQQREAELDELIQKGIELHEANQLVEAFAYFEKAAKGENPLGQLMYGLSLRHGWGCQPNPQKALAYLQKAAEYAMGELNELGPVAKPGSLDPKRSQLLASSLSSSSSSPTSTMSSSRREPSNNSSSNSGSQRSDAEDTRRTLRRMGTMDRKMAITTARSELVMALFELGMSFMKGWGVAKDKTIGFNYFKIAADLGDADSQNEAALCYQDGIGTEKDMFQAAKYYRLAAKQGAGQMGNQWIWKPKYDQYCNAEAAAAESIEQRKRSKSSAASFPFSMTLTTNAAAAAAGGGSSPPNSGSSTASGSTSPKTSTSAYSIAGIAAGLATVTAATAGAASPTATRQSMQHQYSKSLTNNDPSLGEAPVSLMNRMNLAGDLITSTSTSHSMQSPPPSGEKKKHRWSLFPSSRSSSPMSPGGGGHPPMPPSPPRV